MNGNLWEWTQDLYAESLGFGATTDPVVEVGIYHVIKGGSWNQQPHALRSAKRWKQPASERLQEVGFRIVRTYF